jgi:hypothetical protein
MSGWEQRGEQKSQIKKKNGKRKTQTFLDSFEVCGGAGGEG